MDSDESKREARLLGFSCIEDYYAYRVKLKRELRSKGVIFDKDSTTDALGVLVNLTLPSPERTVGGDSNYG